MERQFPDEFPFAARRSQDAAETPTAPPAQAVDAAVAIEPPAPDVIEVTDAADAAAVPEAMEIFTVADPTSVPVAEEVFDADADAVETLSEADVVDEPEAPLASPGWSAAARRLVTPLLAPLGAAAAVPVIVQPVGAAVASKTITKDAGGATRTGAERRRSPRQAMRARASFRSEADVTAVRTVQIVNLSLMGVRLRSNQPMSIGDRGNVRMEVGPVKWGSRVRVIQCEQGADGYEIGCEFVTNELSARPANIVNPLVWAPTKDKQREATKAA
jgi:hypothetical protein